MQQAFNKTVQRSGRGGQYSTTPIATGQTQKSVRTQVVVTPNSVSVELYARQSIIFADRGRPAGAMPPVSAIRAWVAAKGLDISPWAIAKSIAQKGTAQPPANFILPVWREWLDQTRPLVSDALSSNLALRVTSVTEQTQQP
jgi:hypothetical protein